MKIIKSILYLVFLGVFVTIACSKVERVHSQQTQRLMSQTEQQKTQREMKADQEVDLVEFDDIERCSSVRFLKRAREAKCAKLESSNLVRAQRSKLESQIERIDNRLALIESE